MAAIAREPRNLSTKEICYLSQWVNGVGNQNKAKEVDFS